MKKLLTLIFLTVPAFAFAQFDSLGMNTTWCAGKIAHKDNTILKGYIKHNDKLGMIKFKERPDDEEQSFVYDKIMAMEYFDSDLLKHRKFASFHIKLKLKEKADLLKALEYYSQLEKAEA